MNHHHIHTEAMDYIAVINKPLRLFRSLTNINHDIFASTFYVFLTTFAV